jgi:hypothetical protein
VYRFFALRDEKTIHEQLKMTGKRKSYYLYCGFFFALQGEKEPTKSQHSCACVSPGREKYHAAVGQIVDCVGRAKERM